MPNYQNGKIYKLHSYDNDLVYIGSTVRSLSQRLGGHKTNFKENRPTTSKQLFQQSDNVMITLIKEVPCNSRHELEAEERKYIESVDCVNKYIPTRTRDEWTNLNKEKIAKKKKIYNQNNKEKIKIYLKANKEKIAEQQRIYQQNNKEKLVEKKRIYEQANKEKMIARGKIYRQNNKEKIRHSKYWVYHKDLFEIIKPLFHDI